MASKSKEFQGGGEGPGVTPLRTPPDHILVGIRSDALKLEAQNIIASEVI